MANYERDKEDVRVYDGSEDDDDNEGSHLPVVIIITILVLAAFGGVVWLAYNQGVARGRNEPVRVASVQSTTGQGDIKVYQQPATTEDEEDNPPGATRAQPAQTPPAQTPSTIVARPSAPPATIAQSNPPPETVAPKPQAITPPPAATKPVTTPPPVKLAQQQPAAPAVATKPPAQLGIAHPATETPPAAKTVVTKPVATAALKPSVAAAGSWLLQIGAYKSEAEAMSAWKTYQSKHTALLGGYGPDVQRADLAEKGVWYRLRIASFADKSAASALCDRLKAENGACFPAH